MRSRDVADTASALVLVTQLGATMFACVLLGLLGGRYLDSVFDTGPWLTIVLVLAGVAGGMVAVYRMVMEVVVRSSDDGAGGPDETPKDN